MEHTALFVSACYMLDTCSFYHLEHHFGDMLCLQGVFKRFCRELVIQQGHFTLLQCKANESYSVYLCMFFWKFTLLSTPEIPTGDFVFVIQVIVPLCFYHEQKGVKNTGKCFLISLLYVCRLYIILQSDSRDFIKANINVTFSNRRTSAAFYAFITSTRLYFLHNLVFNLVIFCLIKALR